MQINELAATRVRYGYRRIHVLLQREGWQINHKRARRIYRELGLQLRNKTPKRKVKAKLREDRVQPTAPNECWSMDFLSDQLFDGRKVRVLSIVDNFLGYRLHWMSGTVTRGVMLSMRLSVLQGNMAAHSGSE
ncbi:transposase InsO family protein [Sphingorhabdus rigui]|uniref:Transposase InsO family protein n=1 Tax=Sphingorhabdus rigui TaxID=1282858 RepID=A0A840B7B0_9SPHN|nr:transposase InsO family protein [Sphingorhabdus rigui]